MILTELKKRFQHCAMRLLTALAVLLVACTMHSCIDDHMDQTGNCANGNGRFVLNFSVKDPVRNPVQTRADEPGTGIENQVDDIGIWVFAGEDAKCIYYRYLKATDYSAEEQAKWRAGAFSVTLTDWPKNDQIVGLIIIANIAANAENLPVVAAQIGLTSVDCINNWGAKAVSAAVPVAGPFPMCNVGEIAEVRDNIYNASLYRSIARIKASITVDNTYHAGLSDKLKLERAEMMLFNLVEKGTIYNECYAPRFSPIDYPGYIADPATVRFYNTNWENLTGNPDVPGSYLYAPQYLYQRGYASFAETPDGTYNNNKPVEILLKVPYVDGTTTIEENYYRAQVYLQKSTDPDYYIYPNMSYNLDIKLTGLGKDHSGITTTVNCEPWNVEDKELAAGVTLSNTEFLGYADEIKDVVVTKLIHPWTNTIDYTATGSTGVTIGTADKSTPGETGIRATMQSGVNEGWIDITYGSRKQRVVLRKAGHSQSVIGSEIDLGSRFEHKETEGDLPVAVSTDEVSGNMKFGLDNNYTVNTVTVVRTAIVTLQNDGGEYICAYVEQDGAALPHMDNQIQRKPAGGNTEYGYAGTYHRYNERAERVIQMQNEAGGFWRASVVSGSDFIELSATPSVDAGLGTTAPKTGNALEGDDTYYIKDGSSSVGGEGSDIYFRIGLKSTLTSVSDVRYGLVVKYTGNAGVKKDHYIFVRQGEGEASGKFSVYNLRKPEGFTAISPDGFYRPGRAGEFTKYPTQTGFFYRWNVQTCSHPTNRITAENFRIDSNLGAKDFDESLEPCPAGYETPVYDRIKYLAGTEFGATGPYGQQLRENVLGKYADGWYDRIAEPSADARGEEIAWTGMVMFDPVTNESLFFPYSGLISCDTNQEGQFILRGARADFWCKYRAEAAGPYNYNGTGIMTYEAWRMSLHSPEALPGTDHKNARYIWMTDSKTSYGTSVRCVKK